MASSLGKRFSRGTYTMFKKSFTLVVVVLALVILSAYTGQMFFSQDLPSAYDPGLSIDQAFKTSKTPLLVEFYSDSCGTCRKVAPILHDIHHQHSSKLTLVMINVDAPENLDVAKLFGVDTLPGVYVFDFKHMKKNEIHSDTFGSSEKMEKAILDALASTT
jgi:thiol-disulfide isomerase/thioredoxin